eukprot:g13794.t1
MPRLVEMLNEKLAFLDEKMRRILAAQGSEEQHALVAEQQHQIREQLRLVVRGTGAELPPTPRAEIEVEGRPTPAQQGQHDVDVKNVHSRREGERQVAADTRGEWWQHQIPPARPLEEVDLFEDRRSCGSQVVCYQFPAWRPRLERLVAARYSCWSSHRIQMSGSAYQYRMKLDTTSTTENAHSHILEVIRICKE